MLAVRTNFGALFLGGAIMGSAAMAAARHGAFLTAPARWTMDTAILMILQIGGIYILFFLLLHLVAQRLAIGLRSAYAGMAAIAAIATMLLLASGEEIEQLLAGGYLFASLAAIAGLGALVGFLYHARAGYCTDGDDPALLQGLLDRQNAHGEALPVSAHQPRVATGQGALWTTPADKALLDTGAAEYFDGPLQVRTSFGAMIVSGLAATLIFNFGVALMGLAAWLVNSLGTRSADPDDIAAAVRNFHPFSGVTGLDGMLGIFVNTAAGALAFGILLAIPFAAVIYACHLVARAFGKTSYAAYATIGFCAPPALGMLLFFVFVFIGFKIAFPCAIAMVIYRRYAGLEPKHVAEDIVVADRRHLVGANHARRRYGRVINTR